MKYFLTTVTAVLGIILIGLSYASYALLGNWGAMLPRHADNVDAFMENRRQEVAVPGLAVGVLNKDGLQWDGYYGTSDGVSPVTDETVFMVASVSKTVVGTAAMQLWEQGEFDLDDDINDYLSFEVQNPHQPNEPITFRHLMIHRSTIVDRDPLYDDMYTLENGGDSEWGMAEYLEAYLTPDGEFYSADNFLQTQPNSQFEYSNYGNALLAVLVEEISGELFSQYARNHIFEPLGMTSSYFLLSDIPADVDLATPFLEGKAIPQYNFPDYPAGSLRTTVNDMSKFAAFYLDPAAHDSGLLEPETVEIMFGEYGQSADLGEGEMGLVWVHLDGLLLNAIGHTGGDYGVTAYIMLYPDEGYATLLMQNGNSSSLFIERSILKRLKKEGAKLK